MISNSLQVSLELIEANLSCTIVVFILLTSGSQSSDIPRSGHVLNPSPHRYSHTWYSLSATTCVSVRELYEAVDLDGAGQLVRG